MKSLLKTQPVRSGSVKWLSSWACAASLVLSGWSHAAETNPPPAEVAFPKSVFVDDPNGKDPFFPTRNRGPVPVVTKTPVVSKEPNWKALQLRGITGSGDQKFALINNLTFAKGEDGDVKVGTTKLKIKVLEIREKSVVITIEGIPDQKELLLPDRLLPVE